MMKGPFFSVKLRDDVTVEQSGQGRIALVRKDRKFLDVPDNPLIERLIEGWMTEEAIDRLAESSVSPPAIYLMCEKLFFLGLLQAQCMVDGRPLFSLLPAPDWGSWFGTPPALLRRLSPSAGLRREGRDFVLEMPISLRKCIIHDEKCLVWLMEIVRGDVSLSSEDGAWKAFYQTLWLMDALVRDDHESSRTAVWEFHDLFFFHHSSLGFHDDPIGATWRLREKLPPAPLFKPCQGEPIELPEPDGELMEKLRAPFASVLARRRTGRNAGSRPVTIEELGALLHVSARVQEVRDDPSLPCPLSLRPSPSGGALHSLEIYPLVHQCTGLAPGA